MLTDDQNTVIYLMFLNGILFLGLNFIAYSLVFPGTAGSKRVGYTLIVGVISAFLAQWEYRFLISLGFPPGEIGNILLFGFVVPVFLISLVYYRIKRKNKNSSLAQPAKEKHDND